MQKHRLWNAAIFTLAILLALCFFSVSAFAETDGGFSPGSTDVYFVSNAAGSDTNAGTSASAPLKRWGRRTA